MRKSVEAKSKKMIMRENWGKETMRWGKEDEERAIRSRRRGERQEREWGMIFIEGDKAWCLFPRGAQRLIFLFFQINTVLPTYCLLLSLPFPPSLSLSQIGLLSACRPSQRRISLCCSLISPCTPHWLCLLAKHEMLYCVCVLSYFYLCED